MKYEDLRLGTVERFVLDDDNTPDSPYHDELSDSEVDAMIESSRREYHEAWWEYVSEFN